MPDILIRDYTGADQPAGRMGGAHRPSPVDLPRPVHRRRRSRDRLRRLSSHSGTDRVLGGGTGGFGRGTDGRVQTKTNGQAEPVVTAGRRGQEIGQLLIGRVVPEAASRGYEYRAIRQPAARNISTIRECYDAGFRTRPGFRLQHDAQRQLVAAGRRSWMRLHRAEWMFCAQPNCAAFPTTSDSYSAGRMWISAPGPASPVLGWFGRRVGGLGSRSDLLIG